MRKTSKPAGVPRRPSLTNAESEAGSFLGSQPLSRSILRGGSYGCGHSEVSDDDLITAAQRGDQQAFVELCARQSSLAKKEILRIVQNEADAENALGKDEANSFATLVEFAGKLKIETTRASSGNTQGNVFAISSRVYIKPPVAKGLGISASYSFELKEVITSSVTREKL
jgi:hypothetical protein